MVELIELDIGYRTLRGLTRAGYRTTEELEGATADQLLGIPGFGENCLADLRHYVDIAEADEREPTVAEVCRVLAERWHTVSGLARRLGYSKARTQEILDALENFGAVYRTENIYVLSSYLALRFRRAAA